MNPLFYSSSSGWIACVLMGAEILLPYLLRPSRLSKLLGMAAKFSKPYLQRMRPHYWIGYSLPVISLMHAWIPMQTGFLKRANMTGLWLATLALCILVFQAMLGVALQDKELKDRASVRRWHYWMMLAAGFTVVIHIWLNG